MKFLRLIILIIALTGYSIDTFPQFTDHFEEPNLATDPQALNGWAFYTGDGSAKIDFKSMEGFGKIVVDATSDKLNIWWAIIKRNVSSGLNLKKLKDEDFDLRIEARIRSSHAPRRVNLHLNTQRTTDFHSHLMEYNIPEADTWQTISMTTRNFDAVPGDTVFAQLALMDWGHDIYEVDLDYFKVEVVNTKKAGPDLGDPIPYHPAVPAIHSLDYHLQPSQGVTLDENFRDLNFYNWVTKDEGKQIRLLTVNGSQFPIMRWDLAEFEGKNMKGVGVLELTTFELQRSIDFKKDFGMVRIIEILEGQEDWDEKKATYESFLSGQSKKQVFNTQMIIDIEVKPEKGAKNMIAIPRHVLQRLIDGETKGIAIFPLGAVHASFYTKDSEEENGPKLHFSLQDLQ